MNDKPATRSKDIAETLELDGQGSRHGLARPWVTWLVVLAILVAGAAAWHARHSGNGVRYQTAPVHTGDLTVTVTATGIVQPINQVDVGSELSGIIESVDVDYNDHVKSGQVLARLNTDRLRAQVVQSQAALKVAQARVEQANATVHETQLKLQRCKRLAKSKMCSEEEVDSDQADYERALADTTMAKAQVTQAQAVLDGDTTNLDKAVIHSPIDGIVLTRNVEPGQTVAASFQTPTLFTLAENLSRMELLVDVDEADVGEVKDGQPAMFTVDAYPARSFPARISQVRYGAKTVEGVVTYETVLNVDNTDLLLRPGMTATADITVQKFNDVLLVPNAALRFAPPVQSIEQPSRGLLGAMLPHRPHEAPKAAVSNQPRVWVLRAGKPVPLNIRTGATDGNMTQVLGGDLQAGTEVITDAVTPGG